MSKLYKLPLNFKDLSTKGKELEDASLVESIITNCSLLINSRFNSHRYDFNYGCNIWEKDFELLSTNSKWEEEMVDSISKSIQKNEPRLERINISTKYAEEIVRNSRTQARYFRMNIQIHINGFIKSIGEPFYYKKTLYLSPIEIN